MESPIRSPDAASSRPKRRERDHRRIEGERRCPQAAVRDAVRQPPHARRELACHERIGRAVVLDAEDVAELMHQDGEEVDADRPAANELRVIAWS